MDDNLRLTPIQNKVIYCLQNKWVLITDNAMKGAIVGTTTKQQYRINNGVFWRLVDKGLIYQMSEWPFYYILTGFGEKIKTKPINL